MRRSACNRANTQHTHTSGVQTQLSPLGSARARLCTTTAFFGVGVACGIYVISIKLLSCVCALCSRQLFANSYNPGRSAHRPCFDFFWCALPLHWARIRSCGSIGLCLCVSTRRGAQLNTRACRCFFGWVRACVAWRTRTTTCGGSPHRCAVGRRLCARTQARRKLWNILAD